MLVVLNGLATCIALMQFKFEVLGNTSPNTIITFNLTTYLFSIFLILLVIREKSMWGTSSWLLFKVLFG